MIFTYKNAVCRALYLMELGDATCLHLFMCVC